MQVIGEKREGEINITSRSGGMVTIDETYHYIVQADSKNDDRTTVAGCPGLPMVGVTLSAGGLAICKSKQGTRRSDNPILWDFTCSFSSAVEEDSDQNSQPPGSDPNTWVPVRKTEFERLEEVGFFDYSGTACKASNGQWYDSGIPKRRFLTVWRFPQFEPATVTDEQIAARNEVVNSATFKGYAAKTLLLTVNESMLGFYYGQKRRLTEYKIVVKPDTWVHKRIDHGSFFIDGGGKKVNFTSDLSLPLAGGLLDGSGGYRDWSLTPVTRDFDIYNQVDFKNFLRI